MSKQVNNEKPEVYALRQNGVNWQISRRDFLKAAGIGAAALGVELNSRQAKPVFADESTAEFCRKAMAHEKNIRSLYLSADGEYLLSLSDGKLDKEILKCWDMKTGALLSSREFTSIRQIKTARIDGKSCVIVCIYKQISILSLPDMDPLPDASVKVGSEFEGNMINGFAVDPDENLYVTLISNKDIIKIDRIDGQEKYGRQHVVYTDRSSAPLLPAALDSSSLLVSGRIDFYLLNPLTGTAEDIDLPIKKYYMAYSILSDNKRILGPDKTEEGAESSYRLAVLEDNSTIWQQTFPGKNGEPAEIRKIIPTPDETMAVMFSADSDVMLTLISMADGSILKQVNAGPSVTNGYPLVMASDGSKIAAGVGTSIIFYSLPDLEVTGCPVDLSINPDDTEAVEVSETDPLSGQTVTYTLPCGAAIPTGAVCTCNCVAGGVPMAEPTAVPTKVPPACVVDGCSCVGHTVTRHYWHPN